MMVIIDECKKATLKKSMLIDELKAISSFFFLKPKAYRLGKPSKNMEFSILSQFLPPHSPTMKKK